MPIIATANDSQVPAVVMDVTPTSISTVPRDKAELQRDARTWSERVAQLAIRTADDCVQASHLLRSIKGVRADIQRWFAPHVEAAMETKRKAEAARKQLTDEQERMEAPLMNAEGVVKRALLVWEREEEARRREEEQRLQAEAQRRAETETLAAAAELERFAVGTGDAEMLEEANSLLEQPVEAPAVSVKSSMPKVQGIAYRDTFKAHPEVDVKVLARAVASGAAPASFLTPNMTAINTFARATKCAQPVPGVRFVVDRQIAARE